MRSAKEEAQRESSENKCGATRGRIAGIAQPRTLQRRRTHVGLLSDTASKLYVSRPSFVVYEHGPVAAASGSAMLARAPSIACARDSLA